MKDKILDKEGLENAVACPIEDVPIGGDGKVVRLRGMTALQVTQFQQETLALAPDLDSLDAKKTGDAINMADHLNLSASLIARSVIDKNGNRLFGDDETEIIISWPMVTLIKLRDVAMRLSGMAQLGDGDANLNP